MKLIYLANIRLPTEKAHGIQIMKMCEAFANTAGATVELVVPWRFNKIKEDPFVYYGVEKKFTITKIPSLDLIMLGRIGFWIQTSSFAFFAFFYTLLSKNAQVIYSRDELTLFLIGFFKKNIFWETHTKKENFFAARVLQTALGIISITQGLKDFYVTKDVNKGKILVAPDGVDIKQFNMGENQVELRGRLGLPWDKKIIGYIGKYKTMGEPKGVDDLIVSFSKVLPALPKAFLLLVGINENEVEEVKKVFQRAGVDEEYYKIVTHIPQKEAFMYMKASDVLVMNYPNMPHYALYMSPLKLFEYMASGVPIITSDLPSVREILNESNALVVKNEDIDGLLNGILSLLKNKDFSASIAEQACKDVQRYTWDRRAATILSFIGI
ncbi:MAG: glycosyltransferase [Patescibacteria group bacterium]